MRTSIILFVLILFASNCEKGGINKDSTFEFVKPDHFPAPTYTFHNNPVTEAGFLLGKKIFNDPLLSSDGSISCSSCHVKAVAFSDPQHRLSLGVKEREGIRNSPPIANMAFYNSFFWDGGVVHLDFVPPNAIENHLEMDETMNNVVYKMNRNDPYPELFQKAFGPIDSINAPLMLHALSQYMVMLVSSNSKYDKFLAKQEVLTPSEQKGMEIFEKNCATCHQGVLFTDQDFHNNGLDTEFSDLGRARISEGKEDVGKFRTPSLRNVALTSPYMHDGRFETLEDVLDHYTDGILASSSLSNHLIMENGKLGLPLTKTDKQNLIAFLHSLTDYEFIANPGF